MGLTVRARALFQRTLLRPPLRCFALMGLSFIGFGLGTVNLATLLKLHLDLVLEHGWQALMDGAAMQLLELLASGYASMAFYLVFKACEYRLTQGLTRVD